MLEERDLSIDKVQAGQYEFPYHYIPNPVGFPRLSRCKSWRFSVSYLTSISLVEKFLDGLDRDTGHSHIDFGCGDGALIHALQSRERNPDIQFHGVDVDSRAITWARMFNDASVKLNSGCLSELPENRFDSGTLIEVFEHIPPKECPKFASDMAKCLKTGAPVLVTVPSTQRALAEKHYRHFDFGTLSACFEEDFAVESIFGFEKERFFCRALRRLLDNRFLKAETNWASKYMVSCFSKQYSGVEDCGRVGMLIRRK